MAWRSVPLALVVFAVVAVPAYGAFLPSLGPDSNAVEPGAPGPYTGPEILSVGNGWSSFAFDTHKQCGKYKLVFRNLDLQNHDVNGFVHAEGSFFVQFQVIGAGASKVSRLSFSFGVDHESLYDNPTVNCGVPLPPNPVGTGTAGAYIPYYRSDFDPSDGFFVPILTNNVGDGEYAAAIHAYEGDCSQGLISVPTCIEVARAWTRAVVDNCPGDVSLPDNNCSGYTQDDITKMDHTQPWPMILPGDGRQSNDVNGLTVEFGEPMDKSSFFATLNGQPLAMQEWADNPKRDSDLVPLNDNQDCVTEIELVCTRDDYGDAWKWEGSINDGDIVQVEAADLNLNRVVKTVHVGAAGFQATVESAAPEVILNPLNGLSVAIKPGEFHEFNVRLDNTGLGEAHVNLLTNYSHNVAGLESHWINLNGDAITGIHPLPAGGQVTVKLRVATGSDTPEETFAIQGLAQYDAEGATQTRALDFSAQVSSTASSEHMGSHHRGVEETVPTPETGVAKTQSGGGSPGAGFALSLAAVGAAALAAVGSRRRA